ncbi:MAG: hypothetical protein Q4D41_04375 [Prevotellaceae bacterium]|nr:hypothetical protein [Prevotellaceae bacterium]
MEKNTQTPVVFNSLEEIQQRKEQILTGIRNDNNEINKRWKSLFFNHDIRKKKGLSMATVINTGAGLFDGFMLAWKLYNKFFRR